MEKYRKYEKLVNLGISFSNDFYSNYEHYQKENDIWHEIMLEEEQI